MADCRTEIADRLSRLQALGARLASLERHLARPRRPLAVVSEAFALAIKAGVDPAKVREALLGGFAASRVLEVHGERILNNNYTPGFRAQLYGKDMRIAAETLAANETPAPVSAVVQDLVAALIARGRGDMDYSALATVLFDLAGVEVRQP